MADCTHAELEYIGEQKTDYGVNKYYKCKTCGEVMVVTPEHKVYGIKEPP